MQDRVQMAGCLATMLMQVMSSSSNLYQTLIKHSTVHPEQVEHDDSLLRWIQMFAE